MEQQYHKTIRTMATTKLYANKDGERAQVAFMRLGTANGSDKVVRIQRGMQVLYDDWPQCTISANAEHTTGIAPATLRYGQPWAAALIPDSGYVIDSVEVIMNGTDITQEAYQDGVISIDRVTGNVVITVETASVTNTSMFTKRTTGNGITVLNNKALLKGVRGNSLIWNAIRDGNWINYGPTTIAGITYQIVNKNTTINGTSTQSGTYVQPTFSTYSNCNGHKLLILNKTNNNPDKSAYFATAGFSIYAEFNDSRILTVTSQTARLYLRYKTDLGRTYNNTYLACPIVIDLTRMFGAGNEPTTVAAFKKLFPFDLEDYSNTGVVLNNSMTNYVSKDGDEETLQNVSLNVPTLTGKLNGEGESVVIFPNGMKSTINPYNAELSYITKNSSVAANYFLIPYVPKGRDIKIKIKFTLTSAISSGSYLPIFRAYTGEAYEAYRIIRSGTSNTSYIFSCGGKASNSRTLDLSLNTVYTIEMTLNTIAINGTSYSLYDDVGSENNGQFELMAGYNMSLYYFQVYKANELVVDCVPYRKDMTGVIHEKVSDTLIYPTSGTMACGTLAEASESTIYDEIKQDENGTWKAYKKVGDTRATNTISGRSEYDSLEAEEVYILDNQTIPTEITVADQGVEEILPTNGATPTTAPAIVEIQYGSIPSRGLLGGLLGGTKGGGSDEPDYSDGEEITDYEEEQEPNEDSDEPIVEEPLEEPKEDENEEEPKEDIKESPVIDEKQELKK